MQNDIVAEPTLALRSPNRKKKFIAATLAMTAIGGAAFAYWTALGEGEGSAATGTTEVLQITQSSAITGLAPGAAAQTLSGSVTNPGDGAVYVGSVTGTVTDVLNASEDSITATCATSNYAVGGNAPVDATVAGGANTTWTGLTIRMVESEANQDACKGATVVITYASDSVDPSL